MDSTIHSTKLKLLAFALAVLMIVGCFPFSIVAEDAEPAVTGPIEVRTVDDLYNVRDDLTADYILMNDIDLTEATAPGGIYDFMGNGWNPIGSNNIYSNAAFSGTFDGNGHTIKGLKIDVESLPAGCGNLYVGLFANVSGTVKNLKVDGTVYSNMSKETYIGSIAGYCTGKIENCANYANVNRTSNYFASAYVGGICGFFDRATVSDSFNTGTIYCSAKQSYSSGIGYSNGSATTFQNCYNTGKITAVTGSSSGNSYYAYAAGIAYGLSKITNSYNTGSVLTTGYSGVKYATGNGTNTNCYYLAGTGNATTGATSLSEAQMKMQSMFKDFDFENTWTFIDSDHPYPQLINNVQTTVKTLGIEIASAPLKTEYFVKDALDVTGCTIRVNYNSGSELITVTDDMVSGYDSNNPGTQTLTVKYKSYTTTFTVVVKEYPYTEIRTVEELYNIRDNLSVNYILINDLDLTEATAPGGDYDFYGNGWNPIGSNNIYSNAAFTGTFDGNGHTIKGLRIDVKSLPAGCGNLYVGLFANVSGTVKNLKVDGTVYSNMSNETYIGSIAGYCTGKIENCANYANVNRTSNYFASAYVGGICGFFDRATVSDSFNTGTIYCSAKQSYSSGIGYSNGSATTFQNCYNTGKITAVTGSTSYYYAYAAGIAYGVSKITNSYNAGSVSTTGNSGNSCAIGNGTNTNCYYLAGTGNTSTGATSLSEAQMKTQSMFRGFDFDSVWVINPYAGYPYPQLRTNPQNLEETVTELVIYSLPDQTEYFTGEEIVLDGIVAEVTYVSGRSESVEITSDMLAEYDNTTPGTKTVTVNYKGVDAIFEVEYKTAPTVTGLTLVSGPSKTVFPVATSFDFAGCVVRISYDDGSTKEVSVTPEMTTGGNIKRLGKQTVKYEKDGFEVTFEITVEAIKLVAVKIEKAPDKTVYIEGQALDTAGMTVSGLFNNGNTMSISEGYTLSGYDTTPGKKTVKLSYNGLSDTFEVTVNAKQVVGLELYSKPDKTVYFEGEDFDGTGIVLLAKFDNGDSEIIEDYTVSGFTGEIGTNVVKLTAGSGEAVFTVEVKANAVENVDIKTLPAKLKYIEGEDIDLSGIKVVAKYTDGTEVEVTDYTCTGYSPMPGQYTVSVNYKGLYDTFEVEVSAKTMVELTVASPAKVNYIKGEALDLSGMVVTAVYNNGQTSEVFDYTVTGFDPTTVGTQNVGVTYGGFTRYFPVVVRDVVAVATEGTFIGGKMIARLGEDVTVKFELKQNPGVSGFRHTVEFDADSLDFVDAKALGDLAGGTFVVNDEKKADGEVTLLWIGSGDVRTDGDAYELSFKVRETATDGDHEIKIVFEDKDHGNTAGDRLAFNSVSGNIEVRSYWQGDLTGDRLCKMADLLTLAQYVSGKTMTLTEKQLKAADVDENGEIDIHDVILLRSWILDN